MLPEQPQRHATSPPGAAPAAVAWLLYLPAFGILLLYLWAFLGHAWSVVRFPFQIDYGEMPELNRAWLIAQGRPIYVDWSHPPYQMANYTPLYSTAAAGGVLLLGVQFFTGRLLSLASTLLAGACVAAIARALGAAPRDALLGGLLYFAGHPVWNWGALQRVDSLAVGLELLGIAVFSWGWVRAQDEGRRTNDESGGLRRGFVLRPSSFVVRPPGALWAVWATVPIFLAAVYTRQTVVAGALACYGYLLFCRPRLAGAVIAGYVLAGAALFVALQALTGGYFWRHVIDGNLNRWSWATVELYWRPFWRLLHWTLPFAAVAALAAAARRQAQVPLLYLLASAATALTIGKIGSNVNYLLQPWAALALMVALAAAQVHQLATAFAATVAARPWLGSLAGAVPAVWLLVGLQQAFHVPYERDGADVRPKSPAAVFARLQWTRWPLWRLDPWGVPPGELATFFPRAYREDPSAGDLEAARRAHDYVAATPGEVLGEEMSFTVTTGRRIYLQPFEFTQLAEQGAWDQRPLLQDIAQQRFAVVVLRFRLDEDPTWRVQRVNQSMIAALASAYDLAAGFGNYYLYVPKVGSGQ